LKTYALYLESGPQKTTTMVHVVELPGCVANGKTTDAALAATPDAIRAYLVFVKRHGAKVDPKAPFEVRVAEHITKGQFLGQGSPSALYEPDLRPLTPKEITSHVQMLKWSRADLLRLVVGLDARRLALKPAGRGRPIGNILKHVLEAEKSYIYSVLGVTKTVHVPVSEGLHDRLDLRVALRQARVAAILRIKAMTPAERRSDRRTGAYVRTPRRMLRRMLEHEWEHRREIAERLGLQA
jgi:predicted RNase H-like HicB family nuclease/uncharacterized damage-inducible protein DinB